MRYTRQCLKRVKHREKTKEELTEIAKSECGITRLLSEFSVNESTLWNELEKFAEVRHNVLWRMYYLGILGRADRSNSYSRKEYHWHLNTSNWYLTEKGGNYCFPDTAKEVEKIREESKAFHARLNNEKAEKKQEDKNVP